MVPYVIVLFGIDLMNLMDNILMEYILVKLTKKKNDESDQETTNNELPFFFGFRALGNIVGTFFGGRIIEAYGNQFSFKVVLAAPVILVFCLFLYDETAEDPNQKPKKNFSKDWELIKKLLSM